MIKFYILRRFSATCNAESMRAIPLCTSSLRKSILAKLSAVVNMKEEEGTVKSNGEERISHSMAEQAFKQQPAYRQAYFCNISYSKDSDQMQGISISQKSTSHKYSDRLDGQDINFDLQQKSCSKFYSHPKQARITMERLQSIYQSNVHKEKFQNESQWNKNSIQKIPLASHSYLNLLNRKNQHLFKPLISQRHKDLLSTSSFPLIHKLASNAEKINKQPCFHLLVGVKSSKNINAYEPPAFERFKYARSQLLLQLKQGNKCFQVLNSKQRSITLLILLYRLILRKEACVATVQQLCAESLAHQQQFNHLLKCILMLY